MPLLLIFLGSISQHLGLVRRAPDAARPVLASTATVDWAEVGRGFPLVSLWVDPEDLDNPVTGLLSNVQSRKRAWERPGSLSYFDSGALQFDSRVGVRLHGGSSRTRSPVQSFRIYFRDEYGTDAFAPGLLFDGTSDPLHRLVLHNDLRDRLMPRAESGAARERAFWSFTNPLGYDIAEWVGAIVPRTKPVRFFLNGRWQAVHVATEHVDPDTNPDYFMVRWGHDQFSADPPAMDALWDWLEGLPRPLTAQTVSERIDVDNLTRWFLSVLFCATRDAFQGPGQFHDDTRKDGGWFWINWDMDSSFRSPRLDSFYLLLDQPGKRRRGRNDRRYLVETTTDALNHRLTPGFLQKRFEHYRALAENRDVEQRDYFEILERFLRSRHPAVRAQLSRRLGL